LGIDGSCQQQKTASSWMRFFRNSQTDAGLLLVLRAAEVARNLSKVV
jgi:hypothetical protein